MTNKYQGTTPRALTPARARPDQSQATQAGPQGNQGQAQVNSDIFTYLTKANGRSEILYNADRNWVTITLLLETAGPVAVGNRASIVPVLSGKGQLLLTNIPKTFDVTKGNRIYIAATAVSRVQVTIQPKPWLEQITAGVENVGNLLKMIATRGGK